MPQRVYNPIQSGSTLDTILSGLKGAVKGPFNPFAPAQGDPGDVIPSLWNLGAEGDVPTEQTSAIPPTPPPGPPKITDPGQPFAPYQPQDFNLPKTAPVDTSYKGPQGPVNDPLKGGTHDFGGLANQPGDLTALNLHQTQQDPNIALEGLQQARKSEFEDRATQLLKTGNPADVGPAMAWKGQAERYEGDLANPNTPLNKIRVVDSANTAAQQEGFGLPAGQAPSPTQAKGAFARMLDTNKVNAQVDAENIRAQGNIDVTNLQNKAAADRNAQLVEWSKLHPFESATFGKNDTSVKPMAPNQMAPQGPAGVANQNNLKAAIERQRNLQGQFGSAYALMSGKSLADAQAAADADVARYTQLVQPGQQAAPTVTGVQSGPSGVQSGGIPPEVQDLQPGQKRTNPATGETWANRNGQIQRIQ